MDFHFDLLWLWKLEKALANELKNKIFINWNLFMKIKENRRKGR